MVRQKDHSAAVADILADASFMRLYNKCRPYTMTSMERLYSLFQSLHYILDRDIPGDCVECGVWKGGSSMMMALVLLERGETSRRLFLYDTFEGMSQPTEEDRTFQGEAASDLLRSQRKEDETSIWCYSSLEEVRANIVSTGFPVSQIQFVQGKVEETLPLRRPERVGILRLDTDWYVSTKTELELLYPLLETGGVLIIDDFGHWEGARKAVTDYFGKKGPMLHRIDNTGRILIKQ